MSDDLTKPPDERRMRNMLSSMEYECKEGRATPAPGRSQSVGEVKERRTLWKERR